MFDNLTDRLQAVLQNFKGEDRLTKDNIDTALAEVRKALIEADVSLKVIKLFLTRVRAEAIGEKVVTGITPVQKFIDIVQTELIKILGEKPEPLNDKLKPSIIMLLGLQGAGKTTTAAKLALTLKKQSKKVLLVALDLQRPAAIEQLSILANQIEVDIIKDTESQDVLSLAERAYSKAKEEKYDFVIFDTAGRLQIDNELMAELLLLDRKFQPPEKLLVIDSLIGQEAINVAEAFKSQIGLTGAILTKMDGDARGGAALSLVEGAGIKIKFLSTGEKIEALEEFDPARLADRILGFGDIIALVKKAEENFSEKEMKALEKNLMKGNLNFETFLQITRFMNGLGGLDSVFDLMGMNSLFGLNKKDKDQLMETGKQKFKLYEFAIQSMTKEERLKPDIINKRRQSRIASGSGISEKAVKQLLDEFSQLRKVTSLMSSMGMGGGMSNNPTKMAQAFGQTQKDAKREKKKEKGGPFGGGSFLRF